MTEVRKHTRQTASGKTATVRQHYRDTGGGDAARSAWAQRVASSPPPPHVSSLAPAEPAAAGEEWWAEDVPQPGRSGGVAFEWMAQEMRDWRALGEPPMPHAEPMDPAKARLLGCDTPEGMARFQRLRAYREAGYTGPLDRDSNIPDPDDPASWEGIAMLADMQERRG